MKIAFGMIVLNGNYVLKEALESVYPFATQILIAEGPVSYWQSQGVMESTDGTITTLENFPDPDNKITVIQGQYSEKDEQCNSYMRFVRDDIDYVWNLDCDEIFKAEDILTVIKLLAKENYTSVGFKSCTFYGGFNHVLGGFEEGAEFIRIAKVFPGSYWATHRPPTMAHQHQDLPPEKHLDYNTLNEKHGVKMYHYSYVFPDQVYTKVKYYKEAISLDNCIDDYFDEVYYPWVMGNDRGKKLVEDCYNGVHEFKPQYRGECRTKPFEGTHPEAIANNLGPLKLKFHNQLRKYR